MRTFVLFNFETKSLHKIIKKISSELLSLSEFRIIVKFV